MVFLNLQYNDLILSWKGWKSPYFLHRLISHLGLWKYSAHPNYASEQGMWIIFYLYSVAACGFHQFTVIGGLNLVLLFSPSMDLSEGITKEKYSQYSTYLQETPRYASLYILAPLFAFIAASPSFVWWNIDSCVLNFVILVKNFFIFELY